MSSTTLLPPATIPGVSAYGRPLPTITVTDPEGNTETLDLGNVEVPPPRRLDEAGVFVRDDSLAAKDSFVEVEVPYPGEGESLESRSGRLSRLWAWFRVWLGGFFGPRSK